MLQYVETIPARTRVSFKCQNISTEKLFFGEIVMNRCSVSPEVDGMTTLQIHHSTAERKTKRYVTKKKVKI